ncbi:MAG: AsmA-like C-terminal region-containing protein [Pseudomonadota bacterium]|nr:AsmA-like C-terminal region-containing protein [Pseudomonadota bacterium]
MLGIAIVGGLLSVVCVWRLAQGPVSVQFILPYAQDFLNKSKGPFRSEADDLILSWGGWNHPVDMRALNIRLIEKKTARSVAQIGEISVALSFRALLDAELAFTSLAVIRPTIHLTHTKKGKFGLGIGNSKTTSHKDNIDVIASLINELSGPADKDGVFGSLTRASLLGANLRVEDESTGNVWETQNSDISVQRENSGILTKFNLGLNLQGSTAEIEGEANFNLAEKFVVGFLRFDGIDAEIVGRKIPQLSRLHGLQSNISGKIDFRATADGLLSEVTFDVTAGKGRLDIPDSKFPSIDFSGFSLQGRYSRSPDQIEISNLAVQLNETNAVLKGKITRAADIARLKAEVSVPSLPVSALSRYWPRKMGASARPWVIENIRDGTITAATANLTARINVEGVNEGKVELESIDGRFLIQDGSIRYMAPLPAITKINAAANFNENNFNFDVRSGQIDRLKIQKGVVNITGIDAGQETLSVNLLSGGPVRDALAFLSHPRIGFVSKFGLTSDGASGTHLTRMKATLPLLRTLNINEIEYTAASKIVGLALPRTIRDQPISNGQVSLDVTKKRLSASGNIRFAGTPARFKWGEDFTGRERIKRHLHIDLKATSRIRRIFGLDYPRHLVGPLGLNLKYEHHRNDKQIILAELNLKDARIWVPGFSWAKPSGRSATGKFSAELSGNTVTSIPLFQIDAGVFSAAGNIKFSGLDADGSPILKSLVFNHFVLGPTAFTAKIIRDNNRSFSLTFSGSGFDATPFTEKRLAGIKLPEFPPFTLNANFDKCWIGRGAPAKNVKIKLSHDGNQWQRIVLDGALPGAGKSMSVKMTPTANGHRLFLYSADAGALLMATDMTQTIRGGSIEISGIRKGGAHAPWNGIAEMKRFRVTDAPTLARLLSLASLSGMYNALSGKGIKFNRLRFPYRFLDEVLTIKDALAVGSELGITANGTMDFGTDEIDISGTIIPAYTVNSLIARVPIIGPVLAGEKGGGILGAAYVARGPTENVNLKVNPLSAFAPGFMRKFFGYDEIKDKKMPPPG